MSEIQQHLDLAVLTDVVRQAQGNPTFEILDWTVETLSDRGAVNPDGLQRVSGLGRDGEGTKPWSVALKILKKTAHPIEPNRLGYWKREFYVYDSGLLSSLPGPVMPARCYGINEHADSIWIWLELLTGKTGEQWGLAEYTFAAEQIGRFNGACLKNGFKPDAPWLTRDHARTWTQMMNFETAWQDSQVQQCFSTQTRKRLLQLWTEREYFFATLERLPQIFSHFDYKTANLFIRQGEDNSQEVVAVDWGDCGIGALGGDLVFLVGGSAFFLDWDPTADMAKLNEAVLAAYLDGLYATGWEGDPQVVQLGYLAWVAMHFGPPSAASIQLALVAENRAFVQRLTNHTPEELIEKLPVLCEFLLDCANEARQLMKHLNLP